MTSFKNNSNDTCLSPERMLSRLLISSFVLTRSKCIPHDELQPHEELLLLIFYHPGEDYSSCLFKSNIRLLHIQLMSSRAISENNGAVVSLQQSHRPPSMRTNKL